MSVSIMFHGSSDGDDGPFQLGSANGWRIAAEWIEGVCHVYPDQYQTMRQLAEHGTTGNAFDLANELDQAFRLHPPTDHNIRDTLDQLMELLGSGSPDESVTVVNEGV